MFGCRVGYAWPAAHVSDHAVDCDIDKGHVTRPDLLSKLPVRCPRNPLLYVQVSDNGD